MASTTFVDGETLIEASWLNDVNEAIYNPAAAIIPASSIVNTPNTGAGGNLGATTVQAALNELDAEKQPLDAQLTAIAGLTSAANTVPSFTGSGTAALLTVGTASGNLPLVGTSSATETLAGLVQLATSSEAQALTDALKAITPSTLAQALKGTNQSLAANGYQKLPGGLIFQWGSTTYNGAAGTNPSQAVAFPIAFNTVYQVAAMNDAANGSNKAANMDGLTTTGFTAIFDGWDASMDIPATMRWIAVGV